MKNVQSIRKKLLFFNLKICIGILLIYPMLLFFLFNSDQFSTHKVFSSISIGHFFETRLGLEMARYLAALLFLHICLAFIVWWTTDVLLRRCRIETTLYFLIGILVAFLTAWWFLAANAYFYPNSIHASLGTSFIESDIGLIILSASCIIFFLAFFLAILFASKDSRIFNTVFVRLVSLNIFRVDSPSTDKISLLLIGFVFISISSIIFFHYDVSAYSKDSLSGSHQNANKPNIIIIGIDSLRPDVIGLSGQGTPSMPELTRFLERSRVFETAFTPLARTFPAWNSILTGTYPKKHGNRFNLIAEGYRNTRVKTLADLLKAEGYATVYATDEKRFSNIDENFGFEKTAGPPIGAADFILGSVNDFPLANLISNTKLGQLIFPFTFGNRAAHVTYDPDSFLTSLESALPELTEKPVFLSVHLCLAHWPYEWSQSRVRHGAKQPSDNKYNDRYMESLPVVDQQFRKIIALFEKKGYLDNAIVVVVSDHGESFSKDPMKFMTSDSMGKTPEILLVDTPGHGTDALNRKQYEVLLAFRGLGEMHIPPGISQQKASLIDIAPTVADYLDLDNDVRTQFDGLSLKPWSQSAQIPLKERIFFVETGFSVPAILDQSPNLMSALSEGAKYYTVLENGRLVIKPAAMEILLAEKQYAVLFNDLTYAALPAGTPSGLREILLDNESRSWFRSPGEMPKIKSELRSQLCKHYGGDLRIRTSPICQDTDMD